MGGNKEYSELDADELFMTETAEEKREWETAFKMRELVLQRSRLEFKQWEDNFTRRRLLAGARMKKLNLALRQRLQTSQHHTLVDNATGNTSPHHTLVDNATGKISLNHTLVDNATGTISPHHTLVDNATGNTSPHHTLVDNATVDNATSTINPYTITDSTIPLKPTETTSTHFAAEFPSLNNTTYNIGQDTLATNTSSDHATIRIKSYNK
ncbi:uncharacterized protein LOC131937124 [Physella acuta]|uniref:uncharacterized protein LOC131937124 n=1 Tax=Physella acuta TaxID=109671 RepID=UPI0027DBC46B|nr:uncharacterized protein LOC131937124 [Physella acuta]